MNIALTREQRDIINAKERNLTTQPTSAKRSATRADFISFNI